MLFIQIVVSYISWKDIHIFVFVIYSTQNFIIDFNGVKIYNYHNADN